MKKYNIKINRPELTKLEIEQGLDFNKVSSSANAKNAGLAKIIGIGLGIIIAIIIGVIWFNNKTNNNEATEQIKLPTNTNLQDSFIVNTKKDTILVYKTGSQIKIPANAFVGKNGKEIKGTVKIKYREFHNVGEILLSDIPMTYDSAGKQMYFESAGMFDISANQDGNPFFYQTG
ncbi:MAG TPA: hypothetical protein VKG26_07265 [Bacteroidia bacterium]|nr:hypothetical protein [Bacteroidia bacterium]